MTTDIELRLKSLQWARIHRAESWNPKDKDGDLLQAAEKVYQWLKQAEQPAPEERHRRAVAPLDDQPTAEPKGNGVADFDASDNLRTEASQALHDAIHKAVLEYRIAVSSGHWTEANLLHSEPDWSEAIRALNFASTLHGRNGEFFACQFHCRVTPSGFYEDEPKAAAEPSKSSVGNYTLFFDNGELRIAKEGVDLSVGVDLDDLWDDLHQDAAEPVGKGVASFSDPAESPAEQPANRVPQIGDVVSYIGGDAVVFNVAHLPHFSAIRLNSCSQTTVGLHINGGDWTFKE